MASRGPTSDCVTKFQSYCYEYEWRIVNYKYYLSRKQPLRCPERIKSPPGKSPAAAWSLEAFGQEHHYVETTAPEVILGLQDPSETDCWTVILTLIGGSANVWARVDMKIKNDNSSRKRDYILTVSPSCGNPATVSVRTNGSFKGYIPKSEISHYAVNDLIIHIRICVRQLDNPVHILCPAIADCDIMVAPKFDLSQFLENARRNDQCTDVTLVTQEKEFKVHKVVLVSQSPFFATAFEERWAGQSDNKIDMRDTPTDAMEAILSYMYTGNIANIAQKAHNLLPKAEEYQLEGLKTACEVALSETLSTQNVIDILLLADTHNAQKLKQFCLTFIAKNIAAVKATPSWSKERLNSGTNTNLWVEVLEFVV